MKKNILLLFLSVLAFSSCDDLFNPANENFAGPDQMYTDPKFAQGVLLNAYRTMPTYYDNSEYATDDAVTNQITNSYLKMATGTWSSQNNPLSWWNAGYSAMQNINTFLANANKVVYAKDQEVNNLFIRRTKGEAFGLRAIHLYFLLRNHAGFSQSGELLGVPIITEYQSPTSNFNLPRASFEDCVKQIYKDLDSAEVNLPMEYNDLAASGTVPVKFQDITKSVGTYNRVMGAFSRLLFNGLIAKSFRARTALLAASPAFQDTKNSGTWTSAADYAAAVIDYNIATNGNAAVFGLAPNGSTYYGGSSANTTEIDALKEGVLPKEIIWRDNLSNNSDQEVQNIPPSLGGRGYMNPTQNLVDAFPMANGYPINYSDATKSGYDATKPYVSRDPRLASYIIYNGSTGIGVNNTTIYTGSKSGTGNGVNERIGYSTRTGYYMKKRLRMDVNTTSGSVQNKLHYNPRIRYTEIYLAYAEAANEAWGPTGKGTHTYSAYDIIRAIRKRANSALTAADPYLDECALDKAKMRELIRNERRLELSFESFRFWDLRRWKVQGQNLPNLNEAARGVDVNTVDGVNVYSPITVEERKYQEYMYYGPIPYSEVIKYSNLVQNKGW